MASIVVTNSTFNPSQKRGAAFSAVVLPAAIVTVGLFFAMQALIEVDDFAPPEPVRYVIDQYLAAPEAPEELPVTVKPIQLEELAPPPSAEPMVKTVQNIVLPIEGFSGAVPEQFVEPDLLQVRPMASGNVIVRNLQPLTPPTVVYPPRAATQGVQGDCDVYFSVSPKGEPFDVSADCTDPIFKRAAEKAVKKSKFAPKIKHGRALTVTGVVYPIEFKLEP